MVGLYSGFRFVLEVWFLGVDGMIMIISEFELIFWRFSIYN